MYDSLFSERNTIPVTALKKILSKLCIYPKKTKDGGLLQNTKH